MKIILMGRYNPSEILTGPEKFTKRLYHHLLMQDVECIFIEYFFDGKEYSIIKKFFGKEIYNHNNKSIYRLGIIRIILLLILKKPQIIHLVTFERFHAVIFLIKYFLSFSVVYTVHGIVKYENIEKSINNFTSFKDMLYETILYKYSNSIIFLSDISNRIAEKYFKIDERKKQKIYHGADNIFFEIEHQKINPNDPIKAVFVGDYYRKEKGLSSLLKVLSNVDIYLELHVISDNKFQYYPQSKKFNVLISNKMSTDEFADFLRDKEVFFSASKYEPFSITALEGIASGLVPFFTYETGLSEITRNFEYGYHFYFRHIEDIKKCIINYAHKRKYDSNEFVLKEVFETFNWDKVAKQYYNLYNNLINL